MSFLSNIRALAISLAAAATGFAQPPAVTSITTTPPVPSNTDTPFVTATVTPAGGASISSVQLSYSTGGQATTTVFNETMSNTASSGGWDGTGAVYPWTLVFANGAGNIMQTTAANHTASGQGGQCGLQFSKGSSSAVNSATTTNAINAAGTSGYVEFYVATANLASGLGWTFDLSIDGGTTWTTRVSELTGSNHGYNSSPYHYNLLAQELVSTLKMRFTFLGNGTGGTGASKVQIDDITVTVATSSTITMSDDGLHGDGAAGDGVYGGQLPAQPSGTTVTYSITATDSTGLKTILSPAGSYTAGPAPSITTSSPLPGAVLNSAYSQTLTASSGTPGYTWSLSAGALPAGLSLSSAGVVGGTPTAQGTFSFTAMVTDSVGRIGSKAFALTVSTTTAPNVVIILTDDQGYADVGYNTYGTNVPIQTPNIDNIGTRGIRLTKFYPTAVCAPTRSCLLTGRSNLRTGVTDVKGLDLHEHLMPQTFKAAGYQTWMCGKWHIGGINNNANTTTINGVTIPVIQEGTDYLPFNRGFDVHKGEYSGNINYFTHTTNDPGLAGQVDWWLNGVQVNENTDLEGDGGYSTDLLADKAISLIHGRDKGKPMLLYLAFNAVHAGVQAPSSYINKYKTLGVTDTTRATLCGAIDCMDVAIGRVLSTLDSEGITNNTVVFFASDNGGDTQYSASNLPLRGTKGDTYDGGIHTIAQICWPGVLPAGVTSNQYVSMVDMFPTFCGATGVTPLNTTYAFDGVNLWPALLAASNTTTASRGKALVTGSGTSAGFDSFTDPVNGGTKVFKLIYPVPATKVANQLFNMTNDPYETTDLLLSANAASYSAIQSTLAAAVQTYSAQKYPPYIGAAPPTQTVAAGGSITLYAPFTSYLNQTPNVQWRKNDVNISGATSYYNVTDSGGSVAGVYMATLALSNLTALDTANYDVIVNNVTGTATSGQGTLTVLVAPVMATLPAYSAGTTCTVTWPAVAGATSYTVQYAATSDFAAPLGSQIVSTNSATFIGLSSSNAYYFRATATNGSVASGFSNIVSSTQDASAPAVTIKSPAPGIPYFTTHSTIAVVGSASDLISGVAVLGVNGTPANSSNAYADWTVSVPLNVGSNTVAATATDNAGNSSTTSLSVTRLASTQNDGLPDTWKTTYGFDPASANPVYGPLGDMTNDGFSNLLKYAFHLDPTVNGSTPLVIATKKNPLVTGPNYLELSYPALIGALDLAYAVEVSGDLITWSSDPANFQPVSTVSNGDGLTQTVTVRILPDVNSAAKKYLHVKVTTQ